MLFDRVLAALLLGVLVIAGTVSGYWWFLDQRGPPISILADSSFTTDTKNARKAAFAAGEVMRIHRESCWDSIRPYSTHRAFVDHIIYTLTDFHSAQPAMGCHPVALDIEIPAALPPGQYLYRVWLDFDINPIRNMRVFLPDVSLEVLPAKD